MACILIIDDERLVRDTLRLMLKSRGHEVIVAASGRAGLQIADRHRVDLIVTDVNMPDAEGLSLLRDLRGRNPHAKIFAISGGAHLGAVDALDAAKRIGVDRAMLKPFNPDDFLTAVHDLLEPAA